MNTSRKCILGSVHCVALIVAVGLLPGFGAGCSNNSQKEIPLRIGLNIWPGYGAFFIAKEKRLYEKHGVSVDIQIIQDDAKRETALLAGQLDGVGMTMDNLVRLRAATSDLKAIFKYDNSFGADGIVCRKEIKDTAALKGHRIAFALGSTSHFFLIQVLADVGLSTKDIIPVAMSADDAGAAFVSGKLDGAVTWEPWLTKAQEMPDGKLLVSTREKPVVEDVLFVRAEVIKLQRPKVAAFLKACFEAIDFWKANPEEGNLIIAKSLDLPIADVRQMLSGIKIADYAENTRFFGSGAASPAHASFRAASQAWLKEGVIKVVQDPTEGIDPSLVADART